MQTKTINLDADHELLLTADDKKNDPLAKGAVHSVKFSVHKVYDKEDIVLSGFVKWDGCMNFDGGDSMVHICGPEDIAMLTKRINTIYVEAHDMLDNQGYDLP